MRHLDQDTIEDGSTGAPGLAFRLDTNTGLFRPGTDRLQVVTNGAARWEVDASGNLFPVTDDAVDIGSASKRAQDLYLSGDIQSVKAPTSYTPSIAGGGATVGTGGSQVGAYTRLGKLIIGMFQITWGTSGNTFGSGAYTIGLPSTTDSTMHTARDPIGVWASRDPSGGSVYSGNNRLLTATATTLVMNITTSGSVTSTSPFTQANSGELKGQFMYWET